MVDRSQYHPDLAAPRSHQSSLEKGPPDTKGNEKGKQSQTAPGKEPIDESALERFQQLIRQHKNAKEDELTNDSDPSQFLSGSGSYSPLHAGADQNSSVNALSSTRELAELVSSLVDKMWVKRSGSPHQEEVRLDLKSYQLENTELRINRTDGLLTVQFATSAAASYQQLAQAKTQLLHLLQRRYGQNGVTVKINRLAPGDPTHEDSDSEFATQPHPLASRQNDHDEY
ncbi:hypothetical protein BTA51_04855 [Hahella sp. CCB-MM4]|uniref:type III secretion HpaP family protein n=1 Tax=Hahella sp. (strain CCB-MM4) TaxID=1926491 RepID=UPI000BD4089D|nr:type III secretion HpaP family protein [Hahella sp. CCB-MM4]OZG74344.1 hypothetical protein BTA51_04855 [Hahella sp. CCB-MM4]